MQHLAKRLSAAPAATAVTAATPGLAPAAAAVMPKDNGGSVAAALRRLQDPRGEVAKNFAVPGFAGSVSFVTSMTSHFCGDCNRWVVGGACKQQGGWCQRSAVSGGRQGRNSSQRKATWCMRGLRCLAGPCCALKAFSATLHR